MDYELVLYPNGWGGHVLCPRGGAVHRGLAAWGYISIPAKDEDFVEIVFPRSTLDRLGEATSNAELLAMLDPGVIFE